MPAATTRVAHRGRPVRQDHGVVPRDRPGAPSVHGGPFGLAEDHRIDVVRSEVVHMSKMNHVCGNREVHDRLPVRHRLDHREEQIRHCSSLSLERYRGGWNALGSHRCNPRRQRL